MKRASEYEAIAASVEALIVDPIGPDPVVRAFMIARAALQFVGRSRDVASAAELAYQIADRILDGSPL